LKRRSKSAAILSMLVGDDSAFWLLVLIGAGAEAHGVVVVALAAGSGRAPPHPTASIATGWRMRAGQPMRCPEIQPILVHGPKVKFHPFGLQVQNRHQEFSLINRDFLRRRQPEVSCGELQVASRRRCNAVCEHPRDGRLTRAWSLPVRSTSV
jgi:hypothetical protein